MNYFFAADGSRAQYLTPREFAAEYQVAERSVLRWIEAGLPHFAIGDAVNTIRMIPAVEGRNWIECQAARGAVRV